MLQSDKNYPIKLVPYYPWCLKNRKPIISHYLCY